MARRLKTIAQDIDQNLGPHGYRAEITSGYCNTDRKIGRLIHGGKGRTGNLLRVYQDGVCVLEHNAAETYRHNDEVEDWLRKVKQKLGEPSG